MRYYKMVQKSIAMRGVAPTLLYAMQLPLVQYNEQRSLQERNAIQANFDSRYGTDTAGIIRLSSFTIDNPNWVHGVRYAPTSPAGFRASLALLDLDEDRYPDFTFVDVGSGKGATLLYAADEGFRDVVGVEMVDELHKAAVKNLERYPAARDKGRSVCCDALQFQMPDAPLVVFFNYPFSSMELMDGVIRNISQSGPGAKLIVALNYPYDPATLPNARLRLINSARSEADAGRVNYAFEVL